MAKKVKNLPQLDYMCLVGERVFWMNMARERFEGVIQEWNNGVAIILMDDGTTKEVSA